MHLLNSRVVLSVGWIFWAGLTWAVLEPSASAAAPTPSVAPATQTASRERIAKLIEQLGDNDYFVRERAQEELAQIGSEAFDALSAAEFNDDAEISARSQYLVRLMKINWVQPGDSAEVKTLLTEYDTANEKVRTERINQLAALPDDKGLSALCRLVRFEKLQPLSKYAALKVVGQKTPDEAKWPAREQAILAGLGQSPRVGAEWLRVYLAVHRDPVTGLEAWAKLAEAETNVLKQFPNQSRPDLAMSLWKEQVTMLRKLGRNDEALAAIRKVAALESGAPETLSDLIDWLVKLQAWPVIDETAVRFTERFDQEPLLLYTLAQAREAQGNSAAVQEAVDRALKLNEGNQFQHLLIADRLQKRGLLKWSEGEFRQVIKLGPPGQPNTLRAQYLLADMLHDGGRDQEAAEVLDPAVKLMQDNAKAGNPIANSFLDLETIMSRRDFFFACHFASVNNRDKQVEYLKSGLEQNPLDADILIALFRVPDLDAELRDRTRKAIRDAAEDFRRQIQRAPEDAMAYNQLAWLIANTEGDQREALRCSQDSLRIKPEEPGYLDTLGRCHYASGDLENAVKTQSRAVELQSHSGLMNKQLEFFKAELAKKKAS
jgi:tetratricopeptide (TPR) repeat protein